MSTFLSFFTRQAPQPTFVPAASAAPTQILVTLDTTTLVDPPEKRPIKTKLKLKRSSRSSRASRASRTSGKQLPTLPDTPHAPQADRTTFTLPPRRESLVASQWYKDSESDCGSSDCGEDVTASVYIERPEQKTLARKLFFFGFLFPAFWVVGVAIMLMPLRSTPDWELGKTPSGIAWEMSVIRATELRWSKRCLIALILETSLVVIIFAIVKWGTDIPM